MLLSMLVSLEVCLCVCLLLFIHTHPIPETGADLPVLFPLPTTPPMSRSSPGSLTHPKPLFLSTEWPSQESTLALRSANGSDLVLLLVLSSMSFYPLFLPFSLSHTHTLSLSLPDASSMPFHTLLWALPSPKTALSPNQTSFSLPTPTHTTPFPPLPPPLPGATDPSYSSSACAWASTVSIPSTTKPSRQVLPLLFYRLSSHHHPQFLFTFPQCIGIAGGRPSSSYYFVGSQADNLFYLDPHHPRPAIPLRSPPSTPAQDHPSLTPLQQHLVSAYSDPELKTYHCDKVRKMPLRGLDPSMLLGFLCKTSQEWDDLRNRVEHVRRERLVR